MSFLSLLSTGSMQPSPLLMRSNVAAPQTSLFDTNPVSQPQTGFSMTPSSLIMMLLVTLLQSFLSHFMGGATADAANADAGNGTTNTDAGTGNTTTTPNPYDANPDPVNYPPPPPPPPPANYPPPPPPPPPPAYNKILGSAGLFGDPQFGVFSPNLGNIPNQLKGFESNIKAGQTVTLLQDADKGGLAVTGTGIQVDPNNTHSTGIGTATFKSGNDTVTIGGDGALTINGQNKGNLNDNGLIAPIKLASGLTISTSQEIDGANGAKAERFVITNGEYKITAAARKPHPDANGYLDMNFEELTPDAADDASGYRTSVPGLNQSFGIADLLRLEPLTA